MRLFLILILVTCTFGALVTQDKEIQTIPLRVDGWTNRLPLFNKNIGEDIALVILNPLVDTFEDVLRNHRSFDAIIIRSVKQPGSAFYYTDGSGTKDISLPAVEMASDDFDLLSKQIKNGEIHADLTFQESNPFVEFDRSVGWLFMVYSYVIALGVLFVLICTKLFKFGIIKDCMNLKCNRTNIIIYTILCIELISVIIKFINGINLNDHNLLYHHRFSRVIYTIHIPLFIIVHLLWAFWAHRIFEKSRKLEEITQILGNVKIPFLVLTAILIILETLTLIGGFTFAADFPYWSIFVLGFYCLCAIGITIFYTVVFTRIILTFYRFGGSEKAKRGARNITIFVGIFNFGILLWLAMLICNFIPMDFASKRVVGVIGFYGILIDSFALILSFNPQHRSDIKSSSATASTKTRDTISSVV